VDGVFERNRRFFGPKRKDGARKMCFADWGGLRVARALKIAPVQAPLTPVTGRERKKADRQDKTPTPRQIIV